MSKKDFSGVFLFVFVCITDFGRMLSGLYGALGKSVPEAGDEVVSIIDC